MVSPAPVVAAGLTVLLGRHPAEVEVVGAPDPAGTRTSGERAPCPDLVLYDVLGLHLGDGADLAFFVKETDAVVLAISRELRPDLAARALARGADGFFGLSIGEAELLGAVRSVRDGLLEDDESVQAATGGTADGLLGSDVGLTPRETEILRLITLGLSNQDIAHRCFLSINSVKTYIRSAYRRIGVTSRSQAVVWCLQHGFAADVDDRPPD